MVRLNGGGIGIHSRCMFLRARRTGSLTNDRFSEREKHQKKCIQGEFGGYDIVARYKTLEQKYLYNFCDDNRVTILAPITITWILLEKGRQ